MPNVFWANLRRHPRTHTSMIGEKKINIGFSLLQKPSVQINILLVISVVFTFLNLSNKIAMIFNDYYFNTLNLQEPHTAVIERKASSQNRQANSFYNPFPLQGSQLSVAQISVHKQMKIY